MSAPTMDMFDDHHLDHAVDPLSATALALSALAVCSWAAAIVVHATHHNSPNAGLAVIAVGAAATITASSVLCWCASAVRAHHRRMTTIVVTAIADLRRRCHPDTGSDHQPDVNSELRAYMAGLIEREPRDPRDL